MLAISNGTSHLLHSVQKKTATLMYSDCSATKKVSGVQKYDVTGLSIPSLWGIVHCIPAPDEEVRCFLPACRLHTGISCTQFSKNGFRYTDLEFGTGNQILHSCAEMWE